MSDYKEIKGKTIQYIGTDPSNTGAEGQVWYNSAAGAFRTVLTSATFSSGSSLSLARQHQGSENVGTQTAGLAFGGQTSTLPTIVTNTEEYNGSGWSTGGGLNTARTNLAGSGTQTAGLAVGGSTGGPPVSPTAQTVVEEYNGSSWTEVNDISTARGALIGTGPQTATFVAGGFTIPSALSSATEEYDGTSWTTGGSMPASRENFAGTGDSGDGLVCGGKTTLTSTFLYNGTSWSDGPSLNNGVQSHAAIGPTTNVIRLSGFAASGGRTTSTENYDGTSWSSYPATMGTGRDISVSAGGNATSGLVAGGNDGSSAVGTTEELNLSATVITAAAWSAGGALPSAKNRMASSGTQTATLSSGGYNAADTTVNTSEEYDGSAWTAGGNLNTGRGYFNIGEVGTQTAGIAFGGFSTALPVPTGMVTNTEEYDGTSWTNGGNLNTARYGLGSAGIQTAALGFGGTIAGFTTTGNTEEYNGTSWTEVNNLNTARQYLAGCGTQTAAVGASSTGVEEWDGTNWTSNPNVMILGRGNLASAGTQTASIFFGGSPPPSGSTLTESYDGNSFSTAPNLGTGRFSLGGAGTQTSAIGFGGGNPGKLTNTEEFTGETSALNIKTLTTS